MPTEAQFSKVLRDDIKTVYGDSCKNILIVDAPRSNKKDCDVITILEGRTFALELKYTSGPSFSIAKVRSNQVQSLKELSRAGAYTYIVIWFWRYKAVVAIDIVAWLFILRDYEKLGKKSIKFEDISEVANEIGATSAVKVMERKKIDGKTRWEIEKLIDLKKEILD